MIKNLAILFAVVTLITGCSVKPAKVVLDAPVSNESINVYSLIAQDELDALYPIQNSGAVSAPFGLVGVLVGGAIDASVNTSSAETAELNLAGIRNELIDLDFDKIFEEEIIKKLASNVKVNNITTIKSGKTLETKVEGGEVYLLLNTSYKMDIDFRTPFIVTYVQIVQKKDKKKKIKQAVLYQNTFTYFGLSLPVPTINADDVKKVNAKKVAKLKADWEKLPAYKKNKTSIRNKYQRNLRKASSTGKSLSFDEANQLSAKAWSTEYKEQLKVNLREGIQKLFTLISNDMKDKTDPVTYKKQGVTLKGYPETHKSFIIEEDDKNRVIRFTEGVRAGSICSMPVVSSDDKLVCL